LVSIRVCRYRLALAVAGLALFAGLTGLVRGWLVDGRQQTAWATQAFGQWPASFTATGASTDRFSLAAHFSDASVPVLGAVSPGSNTDTGDSAEGTGSRVVTGDQAGTVVALSVFVSGTVDAPPHDQFQMAIYTDSHDAPHALLASSATGTLVADAWNTVPITATLQPHTAYWLLYNTNGTSTAVNNVTYVSGHADSVDRLFQRPRIGVLEDLATVLGVLGGVITCGAFAGLLALWIGRRAPSGAVALLLALAIGLLLEASLKRWLLYPVTGSYPSGHALRIMLIAVVVQYLAPWRVAGVAALSLAVLTGVSRIYVGEHFWYEVLGGAIAGWALAQAALSVAPPHPRRNSEQIHATR